ncbi:mechanosensitive ion channel family protein [Pontibacter arcticus]|uniref:Mechanosensitive ion channel family protein n=1 Tax=Pontibacter arcticus TaxID=2080288 RepID=A0A364RGP3_9BACT|nr:mechanosensitive ion channel domain-containing protein [Pontibacter arcticus]RAU83452.1 mechanosensitive ion channel family protein [Pontibacter arcticus]
MLYKKLTLFSPRSLTYRYKVVAILILVLCWHTPQLHAQEAPADTAEIVVPVWPEDSLGRRTPRGTVQGFISAVADQNYNRAAHYLNMDTTLVSVRNGPVLAKSLQELMDRSGKLMPFSWMNNTYNGFAEDNLGPNLDRVGAISINAEEIDLMVERTEGPEGGPIWLFSSQTVQRIPLPVEENIKSTLVEKVSPEALEDNKWGGVPIGHWLSIVLLIIVAYLLAKGITALILLLIPKVWAKARQETTAGIIRAFALPVQLYLAIWLFVFASRYVGISIIVRMRLSEITVIVGLIAMLLLVWQLLDFLSRFFERRLALRGNQAGVSAVLFLRRGIKVALLVLGIILALDTFGFDVTAGLAALGIGGIALALGAQKTVENFVGSVTLIADQPIRVGDFCKVGSVSGTVEQIGMRSTRIRTADRTIVTIPNGEFSSQQIENFAPRDQFLLSSILRLRYSTTPDQIRYLLKEIRAALLAHEKIDSKQVRVRFTEFGQDSLNLEIYTYINAKDYNNYLEIKEELFLQIMDIIQASGTSISLPSQMLYLAKENDQSDDTGEKEV